MSHLLYRAKLEGWNVGTSGLSVHSIVSTFLPKRDCWWAGTRHIALNPFYNVPLKTLVSMDFNDMNRDTPASPSLVFPSQQVSHPQLLFWNSWFLSSDTITQAGVWEVKREQKSRCWHWLQISHLCMANCEQCRCITILFSWTYFGENKILRWHQFCLGKVRYGYIRWVSQHTKEMEYAIFSRWVTRFITEMVAGVHNRIGRKESWPVASEIARRDTPT